MKKCADVIVTYNRRELLRESLTALLAQTYQGHEIIVVDNASTDDTEAVVRDLQNEKLHYYNTGENLGGAGGFAYGLKIAMEGDFDYAWLMDDDSIPDPTALESLVGKAAQLEDRFSFLESVVYWTDGNLFPMNFPHCDHNNIQHQPYRLLTELGLLRITGGSFVGCFVNLAVGRQVGLPIKEFFIYGDDAEYTHRLKKLQPGYLDLGSTILHKAPSNKGADIATAEADRLSRFYYQSRNGMYIARQDGYVPQRFVEVGRRFLRILRCAPDHKWKRTALLLRGTIAGLFFRPEIIYVQRKGE